MSSKKSKDKKQSKKKSDKKKNNALGVAAVSSYLQTPSSPTLGQYQQRSPTLYHHPYAAANNGYVTNGYPTVYYTSPAPSPVQNLILGPSASPQYFRQSTPVPSSAPLPATKTKKVSNLTKPARHRHSFHQQFYASYSAPILQNSAPIASANRNETTSRPVEPNVVPPIETSDAPLENLQNVTPLNDESTVTPGGMIDETEPIEPTEAIEPMKLENLEHNLDTNAVVEESQLPITKQTLHLAESHSSPSVFFTSSTDDEMNVALQLYYNHKSPKDAYWVEKKLERQKQTVQEILAITACNDESLIIRLFAKNRGNKQATLNEYFDIHHAARRLSSPVSPIRNAQREKENEENNNNFLNAEVKEKKVLEKEAEKKEVEKKEIIEIDPIVDEEIDQWMQIDNSTDDESTDIQSVEAKRKDLANRLFRMMIDATPTDFEKYCKTLFEAQSYKVVHSGKKGDHGIDLELGKGGMHYVAQCKRYQAQKVSEGALRDFYGVMTNARAIRGFFITTSTFTACAKKWCEDKPSIVLIDHKALCLLLEEFGNRMEKRILKLDHEATGAQTTTSKQSNQ